MILNHLNLSVTDVLAAAQFLETHFGLQRSELPYSEQMAFLTDERGFLLSLFRAKGVRYPRMFHIGFIQEQPEQVRAIHQRLQEAGLTIPPPREQHGRLTFSFDAPGGFVIEVEAFLGR